MKKRNLTYFFQKIVLTLGLTLICCVLGVWLSILLVMSKSALSNDKEYSSPKRFEKVIKAFEKEDSGTLPPIDAILCIGSSSMKGWHKTIKDDLSPLTIIPRGFDGSNMNDALFYSDRIVVPYKPRAIVIYEGDNDIAQGISPTKIRDTFLTFVEKIHAELPKTRIYFISIKPSISRWKMWPQMKEANRFIAKVCTKDKQLTYVDVASGMFDSEGQVKSDIFLKDNLHMNRKGYVIWRDILKPILIKTELLFENIKPTDWKSVQGGGQLTIIKSANSPFPHSLRQNGYAYSDSLYSFEKHYNDSSVAVFIPQNYQPEDSVDIVFYFHGWWNNIHKAIDEFELVKQFSASNKNAIFIFPEGSRNSPDSFGGKLEEKDVFKRLVNDVLEFLHIENKITTSKPGKIILAGNSGAYRVISFILEFGGLTENISEVYLFDAFYGQFYKYSNWLKKYNGRLINIITSTGRTQANSLAFLDDLSGLDIAYYRHNKNEISAAELSNDRIIFIFTSLGHNVINPYFELFLETGRLKDK